METSTATPESRPYADLTDTDLHGAIEECRRIVDCDDYMPADEYAAQRRCLDALEAEAARREGE